MQRTNNAAFSRAVQQAFQETHTSFALRMIMSLEDLSLSNLRFVDFMQDFTANEHGFCKHCDTLEQLSAEQLQLVYQFLYIVKASCPACFTQQLHDACARILVLLHKKTRLPA